MMRDSVPVFVNYKREFFEKFIDYIAGVVRRSLELLEF